MKSPHLLNKPVEAAVVNPELARLLIKAGEKGDPQFAQFAKHARRQRITDDEYELAAQEAAARLGDRAPFEHPLTSHQHLAAQAEWMRLIEQIRANAAEGRGMDG